MICLLIDIAKLNPLPSSIQPNLVKYAKSFLLKEAIPVKKFGYFDERDGLIFEEQPHQSLAAMVRLFRINYLTKSALLRPYPAPSAL